MSDSKPRSVTLGGVLTASALMVAMRWTMRGIGLVATIIVARLLVPEDFGVIAMGMVVVGLLETLSFLGVDLVLIQRQDVTRVHFDTAWTISILQGLLVALCLVAAAPFAADIFDEPRVTAVVMVLAISSVVGGFENIGTVTFRRDLDFATEFRFGVYKKLVTFIVTVGCAYMLRSYWALAIGMVAGRLAEVALSYALHPYRPRFCLVEWRTVWSFSRWVLVFHLGNFGRNRIDEMVVGKLTGTEAMGNYAVASAVATSFGEEIALPLARALFPNFARQADSPGTLMQTTLTVMRIITPVVVAIGMGIVAVAEDMVLVILGEKWLAAVPLVQALALYSVVLGVGNSVNTLTAAMGRIRLTAALTWLHLGLLAAACVAAGLASGAIGIAYARSAVALAMLPVVFYVLTRLGPVTMLQLCDTLWRPLAAGLCMLAAVRYAHVPSIELALVRLLLDIAVGAATFIAASLFLWRLTGRPDGLERLVLGRLRLI